ncbi:hypothetical protein chiPu_0027189 [Chiloscyllium punctatum]|uniref:Uncharacterized protein n=1 Tax=Chiloscyllium punctatum TaxID=137246 RepID=A0A401TKJ8_CHIPU|nr:hypothetical protein [Chiloscyllium punctatum]
MLTPGCRVKGHRSALPAASRSFSGQFKAEGPGRNGQGASDHRIYTQLTFVSPLRSKLQPSPFFSFSLTPSLLLLLLLSAAMAWVSHLSLPILPIHGRPCRPLAASAVRQRRVPPPNPPRPIPGWPRPPVPLSTGRKSPSITSRPPPAGPMLTNPGAKSLRAARAPVRQGGRQSAPNFLPRHWLPVTVSRSSLPSHSSAILQSLPVPPRHWLTATVSYTIDSAQPLSATHAIGLR